MKLGRWILGLSLAGVVAASAGPTMTWATLYVLTGGGAGGPNEVMRPDGTPMPTSSDWALCIISNGNFNAPLYMATVGFWSAGGAPGTGGELINVPDPWLGLSVVTRLYNHSNPLLATMYADTGTTNLTWQTAPQQAAMDYLIGPVSQSSWQLIPEPAAAGFVLAGLGALLVRRIRRRN